MEKKGKKISFPKKKKKSLKKKKQTIYSYAFACFTKFNFPFKVNYFTFYLNLIWEV